MIFTMRTFKYDDFNFVIINVDVFIHSLHIAYINGPLLVLRMYNVDLYTSLCLLYRA